MCITLKRYKLISTRKVNEREIFINAWEKGKREFDEDGGGIRLGNKCHPTLIRLAFKKDLASIVRLVDKMSIYGPKE